MKTRRFVAQMNVKNRFYFAGLVIFSAVLSFSAKAQGLSFGAKAGLAYTSFTGTNIGDIKTSNNWEAGLFAGLQLTSSFVIQPELLISKKGATQTQNGFRNNISINYFEIPVLVKFRMPLAHILYPYVELGPDFAFKVSSDFSSTDTQTGTTISASSGNIKKSDIGGNFGIGADLQLPGLILILDGRYNIGFMNIGGSGNTYNIDVKNKGWIISLGVGFHI